MEPASTSAAGTKEGFRTAVFINDVAKYLDGRSTDEALDQLKEDLQIYRMHEQQLLHKRVRLIGKLPEIEKALAAVRMLQAKHDEEHDVVLDYQLADNIFAKARVKPVNTVNLWLGANVMLEYELQEAIALLETNLDNCRRNLDTNKKDMDMIKDCITTTEVSMARVYNHDVKTRAAAR